MSAAAALRRRADRLARVPRTALVEVAGDVDDVARRVGGTMSGLGGQLHTISRVAGSGSSAELDVRGVPRAAWGVAQRGARRHEVGRRGQRLRVGKGVRIGPLEHPGVKPPGRAWTKVLTATRRGISATWADQVHEAVNRG